MGLIHTGGTAGRPTADDKSTPSYSSSLHLTVFQDKSERGAFNMFKKYVQKSLTISKKVKNGKCLIKRLTMMLYVQKMSRDCE